MTGADPLHFRGDNSPACAALRPASAGSDIEFVTVAGWAIRHLHPLIDGVRT